MLSRRCGTGPEPARGSPHGVWAVGRRRLTVGLVALITLFAAEALAVATVMPQVGRELGVEGYGAAFATFFLGVVLGVLLGGPAADRYRPAGLFLIVTALFAVGLAVAGAAPSILVLIAGRAVQGVGAGAATPLAYAVIARCYAERDRVRMFTLLAAGWVLPGIVGPFAAGLVADIVGWRWVFFGLLPLVAAAAALTVPGLSAVTAPTTSAARLPVADALGLTTGVGLLLAAFDISRWQLAVLLAASGIAVASRPAGRMLPAGTFRLRAGLPAVVLARGLLTLSFVTVDAFAPLAVTSVRGDSVLVGAVTVSLTPLVWTVGTAVADRALQLGGPPSVLVRGGFALVAVGIAAESLLLARGVPLVAGLVGAAVAGLGIGLAYSPLSSLALSTSQAGTEGVGSSALALFDGLGFAFGAAATGALVAAGDRGGWDPAVALAISWWGAVLVAVFGGWLASRVR